MRIHHIICIIFGFVLAGMEDSRAHAASDNDFYYKQLGIEHGLSQSRVQSMLYDYKGYMWIGTQYGLNCYDHDVLKHYYYIPGDSTSLPSNDIFFISEDERRNLWIGTRGGLCMFDRSKSSFSRIICEGHLLYTASCLLVDDGILFGSIGEIYKFEYSSGKCFRLPTQRDNTNYSSYTHLVRLNQHTVLANTRWFGVYSYDLKNNVMERVTFIEEGNHTALYVDSYKRIWLSSYGKGVTCYENSKKIKSFNTLNSPLTYDVVLDMEEKDDYLWLATDGGGINMISMQDFSFGQVMQVQNDISSFPSNAIYCLYLDPTNNMWAGSIRNGLIGIREVNAKSFSNVTLNNQYGLSNQTVNCFFQDSKGMVWIGTDGGGVNRYDPENKVFRHYDNVRFGKVTSILEFSEQELLISLFNEGIFYFNKETGGLRPFLIVNEEVNRHTCIDGYSIFIKSVDRNNLLISADRLYLYNKQTQTFEVIASKGDGYERNSPQIKQAYDGNIYIIDLHRILRLTQEHKLELVYEGEEEINDICFDRKGCLWLGTTKGLFCYTLKTKQKKLIETELFRGIISLITDNEGRIWIGTESNLLFVYTQQKFVLLGETDGIIPNEYIPGSNLLSKDGNIVIGGTMGMTIINNGISVDNKTMSSVILADVLVNGVNVKEKLERACPSVSVPWNFSSLQIKVLIKENDIFRKHVFRYHIKSDKNYEELKSFNHSMTVNYLPTGKYTITVSYITPNGEWSPDVELLVVHVTPPWWKTLWFISCCILLLLIVMLLLLRWLHNKRKLMQIREIKALKEKMYEDKIRFLTNISHELRTPLTLICAPLKRILDSKCQIPALGEQLGGIYKQAQQMKEIIDMVLDVRKLEEGKELLHIIWVPMNDWIREVVIPFKNEMENKSISLLLRLDDRISKVPFDKDKCKFILGNLLMNALKFSSAGTSITVTSMLVGDDRVRVEVKDQGIGLSEADIPKLFTLYYQGKHQQAGSGIGLSYAKSLIELHQGHIGCMNNVDKGATFFFELPLNSDADLREDNSEIIIQHPSVQIDFTVLRNYSVLIVEDTPELRKFLKSSLLDYFKNVYVTKDGVEGLAMVKQQFPDIIISDVMMPRMDGFQLCERVKNDIEISHIPIILLTAYDNPSNQAMGYKLGADAFLTKPFNLDAILSIINNQLEIRKVIKARYMSSYVSEKEATFSNADETFLVKLNEIIDKHLTNQEMDVAVLAQEMRMSRSLLYNKVKVLTDTSIIDYVNKQRINRAIYLLENSSLNITEISERVGFSSSRYFSRVFKQQTGIIPTVYKKRGAGDNA